MDNRLEFVRLAQQGDLSVAELCRRFGISRETGFQYLRRYRESGVEGLKDRSRRPHRSPRRTAPEIEAGTWMIRPDPPRRNRQATVWVFGRSPDASGRAAAHKAAINQNPSAPSFA